MRRPVSTTLWLLLALAVVSSAGCNAAEEGESCDADKGNDDCAEGLICRLAHEIKATENVCCPPPPARASTDACQPPVKDFEPNPHVDAAVSTGGSGGSSGAGGSGGSSGASGSSGADAGNLDASNGDASDSGADSASDASGDVNPG